MLLCVCLWNACASVVAQVSVSVSASVSLCVQELEWPARLFLLILGVLPLADARARSCARIFPGLAPATSLLFASVSGPLASASVSGYVCFHFLPFPPLLLASLFLGFAHIVCPAFPFVSFLHLFILLAARFCSSLWTFPGNAPLAFCHVWDVSPFTVLPVRSAQIVPCARAGPQ